jgi:hypothetical protein
VCAAQTARYVWLVGYPEIQYAVAEEVRSVLGGAAPTLDDLERMSLLNYVVDETMRLLPTTPMLFLRRCVEPFELDGRTMPVGSTVVLSHPVDLGGAAAAQAIGDAERDAGRSQVRRDRDGTSASDAAGRTGGREDRCTGAALGGRAGAAGSRVVS